MKLKPGPALDALLAPALAIEREAWTAWSGLTGEPEGTEYEWPRLSNDADGMLLVLDKLGAEHNVFISSTGPWHHVEIVRRSSGARFKDGFGTLPGAVAYAAAAALGLDIQDKVALAMEAAQSHVIREE